MPVLAAANAMLYGFMPTYFQYAAHRQATAQQDTNTAPRTLHFIRGMVHFEPSPSYLQTLQGAGLSPSIFRYANGGEKDRLRQWPQNTSEVIRYFLDQPEEIGNDSIFAGHSAGGFTVFTLGAIAHGSDLEALKYHLPNLDDIPVSDLETLGHQLSTSLFIGIASPLNGILFKSAETFLHRVILKKRRPLLTRALSYPYVQTYYQNLGAHPEDVVDGIIISGSAPFRNHSSVFNRGLTNLVQSGMRFIRHTVVNESAPIELAHVPQGHDAIVPLYSAWLDQPLKKLVSMNHTQVVEEPESAFQLLDLIKDLSSSHSAPARSHTRLKQIPESWADAS